MSPTPARRIWASTPGPSVTASRMACPQPARCLCTSSPGRSPASVRAGVSASSHTARGIAAASSGTAHFCSSANVAASGSPCAPKYRAACTRSTACGFSIASGRGTPIAMGRTSLLRSNKVLFSIPHLWAFINPAKGEEIEKDCSVFGKRPYSVRSFCALSDILPAISTTKQKRTPILTESTCVCRIGVARLELAASCSQSRRATNCATPRKNEYYHTIPFFCAFVKCAECRNLPGAPKTTLTLYFCLEAEPKMVYYKVY